MKTAVRNICFCAGFMMLWFTPDTPANAAFYFAVWFPVAVGLLALSGAFKRPQRMKNIKDSQVSDYSNHEAGVRLNK